MFTLNYAPSVPAWDWVFGTMRPLTDPHEVDYGTPVGDDSKDSLITAHVYPFRLLFPGKEAKAPKPATQRTIPRAPLVSPEN